jgi:hypothetical protein
VPVLSVLIRRADSACWVNIWAIAAGIFFLVMTNALHLA